jgi:hypothetical protein
MTRPVRPGKTAPAPASRQAAPTTVDALMYALRSGLQALKVPSNLDRLRQCSSDQVKAIATDLATWPGLTADGKPRPWLPAWPKENIGRLVEIWRRTQ